MNVKITTTSTEESLDEEILDELTSSPSHRRAIFIKVVAIFIIIFVALPFTLIYLATGSFLNQFYGLSKDSRDQQRISDLSSLNQLISQFVNSSAPNSLCAQTSPCIGFSFSPTSPSVNGQGWVKVDFSKNSRFASTRLPLDPINNLKYYYRYCSDGKNWELDAKLESSSSLSKANSDGGDDPELYEIGTNLTLCPK